MSCSKKDGAYWAFITEEAERVGSDGCTSALELCKHCCYEHDLAFHYRKDPRHTFKIWQDTGEVRWDLADPISFITTNNRFASCLPWYLRYRWLAVMTGGWLIWNKKN
jgi:hypothetical protein